MTRRGGAQGKTHRLSRDSRRLRLLRWQGIDVVIDVGAFDGRYGAALRRAGFTGRIVSFEPLRTSYEQLASVVAEDPLWEARPMALGSTSGRLPLHVTAEPSCSTLRAMKPRHVEAAPGAAVARMEVVQVERLDDLWRDIVGPESRVYLKIDVQGSELDVLDGVGQYIDAVKLLELELSLVPLYEDTVGWQEIVRRLDEQRFALRSVERVFDDPATGEMLQIDGIFVREAVE